MLKDIKLFNVTQMLERFHHLIDYFRCCAICKRYFFM